MVRGRSGGLARTARGRRPLKAFKLTARHVGRAGLFGVAVAAALTVFAAAFVIRLFLGPISLGPFAGDLRSSLSRVVPGLLVRFDDAALEWSREESRLDLVILGAKVFDENQRIIAQAPKAEVGLAVIPFLKGHIEVRRIALVGVQLTLVHSKDGVLRLGVAGERGQGDILQRIRDAIAKSDHGSSTLESFEVDKARLAFYEEETGVFLVAPRARLQVTRGSGDADNPKGAVKATVDADVEISGKPARVEAVLRLPAHGNDITGDASITGLSLKALAANAQFFSFLAPFDLNADMTGSFALAHGTRVRAADFGIGAAGTVNGLGRPLHVRAFRVTGRYDGATGRLLIDDSALEGVQAQAHLNGSGNLGFDSQGVLAKVTLDLQLDKLAIDMPGVMGRSVSLARAAVRGSYTPATQTLAVEQAFVFGGPLSAKLAGRVQLAQDRSPAIDIDGNIAAIGVRDLLRFWPLQAAPGARDWIDANVSAGRLGPVLIHTHIPAGALDAPALPESAVNLSFPVSGATITYIHGLTPMTGVQGTAVLTGDTFKAAVDSAAVGPLVVSNGRAVIPNLHVHGTQGTISAHVAGSVPEVLALIDQKPLHYPSRFHIRTATAKGDADVSLSVRVPMLHDLSVSQLDIAVQAATTNLGLALNDHLTIANGAVNFAVDNSSLHAVGTVSVGSANLGIDWSELFNPKGQTSTRLKVNGSVSDAAREALGIKASDYLSGPVGVNGELDGYRGKIQRAQLKLDLTPALVTVKLLGFRKPAGSAAQALLNLRMDANGNVRNADFLLSGAALAARGSARLGPNGTLQALDLPIFKSGTTDDFALSLTRDPAQGVTVSMTGHSFDDQELLKSDSKPQSTTPQSANDEPPEPYHISSRLDRVVMRDGVVLAPFALTLSGVGTAPRAMSLNAMQSKTAQLTGTIANGEDGTHVSFAAGDAGLLLRGLFGSSSLKGGTLAIDAIAATPAASAKGMPGLPEYKGKLTISDFTVVNQPFLTRLFSAGSFGGLADLMRGKGIAFDKLETPFDYHGTVLTVREARATGPSLGLTADGYYDLKSNQLGLQGAFTPLYGINGVLGSLPILGSVLGSKKGEGLIGVTYSASGSADDPNVFVNPLSMLTPGILRRIFQGNPPSAPPAQANTTPPTPLPKPQPQ